MQRVDVIAVGSSGLGEPSQHHDAGAAAEDGAAGVGVESAAMAVGRQDLAFLVEVAEAMRQLDADATGKCQVAFAVQQALAAMWMATSDVEQAVCTATLGPFRSRQ